MRFVVWEGLNGMGNPFMEKLFAAHRALALRL